MSALNWYPGNYTGFGVKSSRVYVTPIGQVLCVLAEDIDPVRADPIVMACGMRPTGNGGLCWCVAPLLGPAMEEPPFPNASFGTIEQMETYLQEQFDQLPAAGSPQPISEDELIEFVRFLDEGFTLPPLT